MDLDGRAAFGHARLAILDLSEAAAQPMIDPTGRYAITYNGEVYNFAELRRELTQLGRTFQSSSDTDVVLAAYAAWGTEAFARFDGMFAFAIWDLLEKRLILARDRFGEKPLYYAHVGGRFIFASELSAILTTGLVPARPPTAVTWSDYLALGYVPAPFTAHPDIRKLEAASFLVFDGTRVVETKSYWSYADCFRRKRTSRREDLVVELGATLQKAVTSRLVSDVPVGAFLSGGLDSSTIVALMKKSLPYELHTFSVGFEPSEYDESADARRIADFFGTRHHEHSISVCEGAEIARQATDVYDEPFSDTSLVPMVAVAREASRHVKVALSGDGADEIFAGYVTYRADLMMQILSRVPSELRAAFSRTVRSRLREEESKKTGWRFKVRQFAKGLPVEPATAHASWRELHALPEVVDVLGKAHAQEIGEHPPTRHALRYYAEVPDLHWLDQHLYVDAKTWLVDDVLVKVDRAAMASSLETRAPFLAVSVAELAAALPPSLKLGPRKGKIALRQVASGLLPTATMQKSKAGFSAPVNAWFGWNGDNEYKHFNRAVRSWWTERFASNRVTPC